jgi:hypothetical protein
MGKTFILQRGYASLVIIFSIKLYYIAMIGLADSGEGN